jgi:hypothetical protein
MNSDHNYADSEVKGLARYIPNTLSRILLGSMIGTPPILYISILQYREFLLPEASNEIAQYKALIASAALGLFLAFLLILELSVIINHSKHRSFTHHSNVRPHMSFKWLLNSASAKHLFFLMTVFFAGVFVGTLV